MTIKVTIHNTDLIRTILVQRVLPEGNTPLTEIPPDTIYSGVVWEGATGGMLLTEVPENDFAPKPDPAVTAEFMVENVANDAVEPELA